MKMCRRNGATSDFSAQVLTSWRAGETSCTRRPPNRAGSYPAGSATALRSPRRQGSAPHPQPAALLLPDGAGLPAVERLEPRRAALLAAGPFLSDRVGLA